MVAARSVAVTMALSALTLLAGCATTHGNLTSSADKLEHNANVLARDTNDDTIGGYSRDARAFADEAHDFRRTVEDRRADDRDVRTAFEELSRDYHDLRDNIERSDSREARIDLQPVTDAYLDVEREVKQHPDNYRYAHDADTRDRY